MNETSHKACQHIDSNVLPPPSCSANLPRHFSSVLFRQRFSPNCVLIQHNYNPCDNLSVCRVELNRNVDDHSSLFHETTVDEFTAQTGTALTNQLCRRIKLQHKYDWFSTWDVPDFGFESAIDDGDALRGICAANRSLNFVAMDSRYSDAFVDALGMNKSRVHGSVFLLDVEVNNFCI